jgi:hypothetical protein
LQVSNFAKVFEPCILPATQVLAADQGCAKKQQPKAAGAWLPLVYRVTPVCAAIHKAQVGCHQTSVIKA